MHGYARRMRRGTKALRIMLVAVLLMLNAVLLFFLLRPDRALTAQPAEQPTPVPSEFASTEQTASASPTASKESTPSTRAAGPAPAKRLLLAMSSKSAWRATVGDCDTPGEIERSTDGGASWKRVVQSGSAPIVRLGVDRNGDLFTIGGSRQSCSARYAVYANDGAVTASVASPADVWFTTPIDRDEISGPGDTRSTPCTGHVVGLAALDLSSALVICDNGVAMSTTDSGRNWQRLARIPNTLAVAAGDGRYWIAGSLGDCDGISVRQLTVTGSKLSLGFGKCAPVKEVRGGEVALDVSKEAIWIWGGSRIAVTTDDGRTWE
jgi:hypothetical protein